MLPKCNALSRRGPYDKATADGENLEPPQIPYSVGFKEPKP